MRNIMAIAGRELKAYFASPVGWVALSAFVFLTGVFFVALIGLYNVQATKMAFNPYGGADLNVDEYLVAPFFGNMGIILLFICPALTMRLLAEDRKSRSLELLLTSPVSTTEVVLGKYLGAMGFFAVLLVCTAHYPLTFFWLGDPDPGVMASSYLALGLLVGAFMAVGLMASAFTENQFVSLVVAFGLLLTFWILGWAETLADGTVKEVLAFASLINRMEDLAKGLVHLRDLVYYSTFIGFFLFLTHQRVEAYRWR